MCQYKNNAAKTSRRGTVATLVAVSITVLLGVVAITLDGGLLQDNKRRLQSVTDAAALAAANKLFANFPSISSATPDPSFRAFAAAFASAKDNGFAHNGNDTTVVVNIPPTSGPFTGKLNYVEVIITYKQPRYFSTIWGSTSTPIVARAVARAYWGGSGIGILVLDPTAKDALDSSGTGSVVVTGSAAVYVDSNNVEAARVTGGGGLAAANFEITGGYIGPITGNVETGVPPIPDPLASLPVPPKPLDGTMTKTNLAGGLKLYFLTPGRYVNLPNFGNGDTVILQQGGIYYIDGGGLNSTNGATIMMDPNTSGGVMIYNVPNGSQPSQGINISGGSVTLSALTSGPYAGIVFWQDRQSDVPMSFQGQGGFNISGTFYAANALLSVTGQGTNKIGSQYISRFLNMSGGGLTQIDYNAQGTARMREVRLVE